VDQRRGKIYAISAPYGRVEWAYQTGGEVLSSPTAANGLVYVGNENNPILTLRAATGR
jgi:eukaryotic-like serine/threonine-protein kinase